MFTGKIIQNINWILAEWLHDRIVKACKEAETKRIIFILVIGYFDGAYAGTFWILWCQYLSHNHRGRCRKSNIKCICHKLLFVCLFFSEIREREPTLKRKFSDVHGNENGVESSTKIVTNENLNGDHKTDDDNSTVEPLLSGPEVSLSFNPTLHICWKWSWMVDVFTSLLNNV